MKTLAIPFSPPLQAHNAGLFVSPGYGIHPDRVISTYELILVRSGTLQMEEEGVAFAVNAGETLLLWPGLRHRGTRDYARDLSFYWIHFEMGRSGRGGREALRVAQHARPGLPVRLAELFHRFLDDQESGNLLPGQGGLLVGLMLLELGRPAAPVRGDSLAARAEQFIAAHFGRGIHAGDVATALGRHPDYLARVFRGVFGCTLSDAIHRRQIAEARALLRESPAPLEEIARACGFAESRYFRELFFQREGMSPRAYRQLYMRQHINTR